MENRAPRHPGRPLRRLIPVVLLALSLGAIPTLHPAALGATAASGQGSPTSESSSSPRPSESPRPSSSPEPSGSPRPSGSPEPSESPRPSASPRPSSGFDDVGDDHPERTAIAFVADKGIVHGYGDGRFGPDDHTLRAQMAAMIARALGWDLEDHGNGFHDRCDDRQRCIDDDLWRNIGALSERGVVKGYQDGTYGPFNEISQVQTISFIARAMVAAGRWTPVTVDNPALYPNVTLASGHRLDLLTYVSNAGAIPDRPTASAWADWEAPATRAWFAQLLYQALAGR